MIKFITIVVAIILFCLNCTNTSSPQNEGKSDIKDSAITAEGSYCIFFESQLYTGDKLCFSGDTILIFSIGKIKKTWFDNDRHRYDTLLYNQILDSRKKQGELCFDFKDGPPKLNYASLSSDKRKEIQEKGLKVSSKKIQQFKDNYFLLDEHGSGYYPYILVLNQNTKKVDTLVWDGNITEDKIENFFLYDPKHNSQPEIVVFSKDMLHEDSYRVTIIASTPFNCSEKFKSLDPNLRRQDLNEK